MKWKRGAPYGVLKTVVLDENSMVVATVFTRKLGERRGETIPCPEGEANLNLVVAAPELLEALETVEPFVGTWHDRLAQIISDMYDQAEEKFSLEEAGFFQYIEEAAKLRQTVRAAIAKARGKS